MANFRQCSIITSFLFGSVVKMKTHPILISKRSQHETVYPCWLNRCGPQPPPLRRAATKLLMETINQYVGELKDTLSKPRSAITQVLPSKPLLPASCKKKKRAASSPASRPHRSFNQFSACTFQIGSSDFGGKKTKVSRFLWFLG